MHSVEGTISYRDLGYSRQRDLAKQGTEKNCDHHTFRGAMASETSLREVDTDVLLVHFEK